MSLSTSGISIAAGSAVDFHLHTVNSDGRWTPDALIDHLLHEEFSLVAVTDHDRVDTTAAVQQLALAKGLPVLVAVGMSCQWKGELTDLLCFGFDPETNTLNALAQ